VARLKTGQGLAYEKEEKKTAKGEVAHRSSHFSLSALKSIRRAVNAGTVPEKGSRNSLHHATRVFLVCFLWNGERSVAGQELETSENSADSQVEVLHIIFPFDKLSGEWKLICWCFRCLVGFCRRRHEYFFSFFDGESKRKEQCERDEGDRDDDPILDKGGLTGTVRLWPNRAAAVCVDSTELDRPPISDGGATWQRQTEERTNGC
jgi:hypothetical protein